MPWLDSNQQLTNEVGIPVATVRPQGTTCGQRYGILQELPQRYVTYFVDLMGELPDARTTYTDVHPIKLVCCNFVGNSNQIDFPMTL